MKREILVCDFCGLEGHDPKKPEKACIEALKKKLAEQEKEIKSLRDRQHITIPLTPRDESWPYPRPRPFLPGRYTIVD